MHRHHFGDERTDNSEGLGVGREERGEMELGVRAEGMREKQREKLSI